MANTTHTVSLLPRYNSVMQVENDRIVLHVPFNMNFKCNMIYRNSLLVIRFFNNFFIAET